MSKFRKLVENTLKEYWGHNPYDDEPDWDKYYDWLNIQDYKYGYAVLIGKDEKGEDLFATADKSISNDPSYYPETYIEGGDPALPDVFEYNKDKSESEEYAKKQAEEFAKEWKQHFPDSNPEVVKVYSRDEDGYGFYRDLDKVYDLEYYEDYLNED